MVNEVFAVPEFLQMYNDIGIYPGKEGAYPNPDIVDLHEGQLVLDLAFYVPESLFVFSSLLPLLLIIGKRVNGL